MTPEDGLLRFALHREDDGPFFESLLAGQQQQVKHRLRQLQNEVAETMQTRFHRRARGTSGFARDLHLAVMHSTATATLPKALAWLGVDVLETIVTEHARIAGERLEAQLTRVIATVAEELPGSLAANNLTSLVRRMETVLPGVQEQILSQLERDFDTIGQRVLTSHPASLVLGLLSEGGILPLWLGWQWRRRHLREVRIFVEQWFSSFVSDLHGLAQAQVAEGIQELRERQSRLLHTPLFPGAEQAARFFLGQALGLLAAGWGLAVAQLGEFIAVPGWPAQEQPVPGPVHPAPSGHSRLRRSCLRRTGPRPHSPGDFGDNCSLFCLRPPRTSRARPHSAGDFGDRC